MKKPSIKNTPPIEPVKFWEVVQCGIQAGQHIDPAVQSAASQNNPWQQAAQAIAELLQNDQQSYGPAMVRFQALMDLYVRDVLNEWMRPSTPPGEPGTDDQLQRSGATDARQQASGDDIHPAVIDVAATMRLSANGRFATRKFLEAVQNNVEQNYRDFAPWPLK